MGKVQRLVVRRRAERFEMESNLFEEKVKFAKEWFKDNNIEPPTGAKIWSKSSVTRKEIPPGCSYDSLRKYGINVSDFIAAISGVESKKVRYNPITQENCVERTGLDWLSYKTVHGHKRILTKCTKCNFEEVLDYGTLQRMVDRNDMLCRICREVGGKRKPLDCYNRFEDFEAISFAEDSKINFKCNKCNSVVSRHMDYVIYTEYLCCEVCFPKNNTSINTEYGKFHSKLEYLVYKELLKIFNEEDIVRQLKYSDMFEHINTKHTADFYIIPIDLVIEVTPIDLDRYYSIYKDTLKWKLAQADNIVAINSVKQVKDIVQPYMKV